MSVTFDEPVPLECSESLCLWARCAELAHSISIPRARLELLRRHIDLIDLESFLEDCVSTDTDDCALYGLPPHKLEKLVARLKDGFDWIRQEALFRQMGEHLKIQLHNVPGEGDFAMHVVHRKATGASNGKVICLVHGWPGSFYEFVKLAPLLSDAGFDLVIPSLPGYGYSGAIKGKEKPSSSIPWTFRQTAFCIEACMRALGYKRFVVQGGDWGAMIARVLAVLFPERVTRIHINHVMSGQKDDPPAKELTENEKRGLERRDEFVTRASAYSETNATVTHTIGAMLSSSPLACVAWIGEKLYRWSAPDSQPTEDDVLTFALLYWLTGRVSSSCWLYYNRKSTHKSSDFQEFNRAAIPCKVAIGLGKFELYWPTKNMCRPLFPNLVSFRHLEDGGHFLAFETPETLFKDVLPFFEED